MRCLRSDVGCRTAGACRRLRLRVAVVVGMLVVGRAADSGMEAGIGRLGVAAVGCTKGRSEVLVVRR